MRPRPNPSPALAGSLSLLVALGCASRVAPVTAPVLTPASAPRMRVAPLTFTHGGRVECSLSADGAITLDGQPWARIDGSRIVSTDGTELARIDGNTVIFRGSSESSTLVSDGSLRGRDGSRLSVNAEGYPTFTAPDRPGEMVMRSTRVEGVTDATRPTAVLMLGALMMRAREVRADAPESP